MTVILLLSKYAFTIRKYVYSVCQYTTSGDEIKTRRPYMKKKKLIKTIKDNLTTTKKEKEKILRKLKIQRTVVLHYGGSLVICFLQTTKYLCLRIEDRYDIEHKQ